MQFEFLRPFSKDNEKTSIARFSQSCFALDQRYIELRKKTLIINNQQCFAFTLLVRPTQAKIQMLTTSSRIVTILLKFLLKSLGLYLC